MPLTKARLGQAFVQQFEAMLENWDGPYLAVWLGGCSDRTKSCLLGWAEPKYNTAIRRRIWLVQTASGLSFSNGPIAIQSLLCFPPMWTELFDLTDQLDTTLGLAAPDLRLSAILCPT